MTTTVLFITRDESEFPECYSNDGSIAMILDDQDVKAMAIGGLDVKAMATGGLDVANDRDVFEYVNHVAGKNGIQFTFFDATTKFNACRTFEYSGEEKGRCSYADLLYNIKQGDEFEFPEDLEALRTMQIGESRRIAQWMGTYFDFTRIY